MDTTSPRRVDGNIEPPAFWRRILFSLRRGLHVLLLRNSLLVLLLLPLGALLYDIAIHAERSVIEVILANRRLLALFLLVTLLLVFRRFLQAQLDRLFFRRSYQHEKSLYALCNNVNINEDLLAQARRISRELAAIFQPSRIYFFLRDPVSRDFTIAYSYDGFITTIAIPEHAALRHLLRSEHRALPYPFAHGLQLPPEEANWLEQLRAQLLVPLMGNDKRVVGLLVLGHSNSGHAYTAEEGDLLVALGRKIALTYERSLVKEQVEEEAKIKLETIARLEAEQINLRIACPACGFSCPPQDQLCPQCHFLLVLTKTVQETSPS